MPASRIFPVKQAIRHAKSRNPVHLITIYADQYFIKNRYASIIIYYKLKTAQDRTVRRMPLEAHPLSDQCLMPTLQQIHAQQARIFRNSKLAKRRTERNNTKDLHRIAKLRRTQHFSDQTQITKEHLRSIGTEIKPTNEQANKRRTNR